MSKHCRPFLLCVQAEFAQSKNKHRLNCRLQQTPYVAHLRDNHLYFSIGHRGI